MSSVVSADSSGSGTPRAIIFARSSSADQGFQSIENQIRECEKFLKKFGSGRPDAPPSAIPPGGDK
jgi:hypothetical protein